MRRLRFSDPVTLAGGGVLEPAILRRCLELGPHLVAADGAADRLLALGFEPEAVIGDMDSLADPSFWEKRSGSRFVRLDEQDSTDFEKCLYTCEAPFYLACGFTGGRSDHLLASLHVMLARPEKPVLLIDASDVIAMLPADRPVELPLPVGSRVSLMPLATVTCLAEEGLDWPVAGLGFEPGKQIGVSNRSVSSPVRLSVDREGLLLITDSGLLQTVQDALFAV